MEPIVYVVVIGCFVVAVAGVVTRGLRSIVVAAAQSRAPAAGAEVPGEAFEALEERVEQLRRQVAELAERQEFAERLLAQARERGLPPGSPPK